MSGAEETEKRDAEEVAADEEEPKVQEEEPPQEAAQPDSTSMKPELTVAGGKRKSADSPQDEEIEPPSKKPKTEPCSDEEVIAAPTVSEPAGGADLKGQVKAYLQKNDLDNLWRAADRDGQGFVDHEELATFLKLLDLEDPVKGFVLKIPLELGPQGMHRGDFNTYITKYLRPLVRTPEKFNPLLAEIAKKQAAAEGKIKENNMMVETDAAHRADLSTQLLRARELATKLNDKLIQVKADIQTIVCQSDTDWDEVSQKTGEGRTLASDKKQALDQGKKLKEQTADIDTHIIEVKKTITKLEEAVEGLKKDEVSTNEQMIEELDKIINPRVNVVYEYFKCGAWIKFPDITSEELEPRFKTGVAGGLMVTVGGESISIFTHHPDNLYAFNCSSGEKHALRRKVLSEEKNE